MYLIICGPPASGKGTQARKISLYYSIPATSMGDLLREVAERGTKLGLEAEKYIAAGNYVPDDIVIPILKERLRREDYKKGFILDGYPRTLEQAFALENIFKEFDLKSELVIFLEIAIRRELMVKRMIYRRICPKDESIYNLIFYPPKNDLSCDVCGSKLIQRNDDKEGMVDRRIKEYLTKTKPVIEFYKKKERFVHIDGEKSIEEVFQEIIKVLNNLL